MAVEKFIQKLVNQRQIGLTTIEREDKIWGSRLQTAIARGTDELIFWGLGPDLQVGDVVALYITNNRFVAPQDRKSLSSLYSIAAISSQKDTEILLLRTDPSRKWPTEKQLGSGANGVTRMEFEPPHEEAVYKEIKKLLNRRVSPNEQLQPTQ